MFEFDVNVLRAVARERMERRTPAPRDAALAGAVLAAMVFLLALLL